MGKMDGKAVQETLRGAAYAGVTDTTMGVEVCTQRASSSRIPDEPASRCGGTFRRHPEELKLRTLMASRLGSFDTRGGSGQVF